ncbi:hypothetical protein BKA70DRAFT_1445005 [Coprinopsis sp. MPI-PUGE-AT-0042]|nr:hypothetical protein BKA70DRAFT_1445005 [Coprinopsis sp. MPI-PUGE-AT-0042]
MYKTWAYLSFTFLSTTAQSNTQPNVSLNMQFKLASLFMVVSIAVGLMNFLPALSQAKTASVKPPMVKALNGTKPLKHAAPAQLQPSLVPFEPAFEASQESILEAATSAMRKEATASTLERS